MQKWIEPAVWTPVPGCLASDVYFEKNMQRFKDLKKKCRGLKIIGCKPSLEPWTRLIIF
jgi:hypothetical protein